MDDIQPPYLLYIVGVGFIGRHLTTLLVEEGLVSKVRVVDKVPPSTGWLNPQHKVLLSGATLSLEPVISIQSLGQPHTVASPHPHTHTQWLVVPPTLTHSG